MSALRPGLCLLALGLAPAWGQDVPPRLALDLGLSASHATNPDLLVSPQASDDLGISFGLSAASSTPDQDFRLSLGGEVQTGGLGTPSLDLSYARRGANAAFQLTASQASASAGSDDDLTATGSVQDSDLALGVQTGLQGRLGFDLLAQTHLKDYSQSADPDLADVTSRTLSAGVTLRALAGGDLTLTARQTAADFDDILQTTRESQSLSLGYTRPLDGATEVTASLGTTAAETRKLGFLFASSSGLTGALALKRAMTTGTAELGFQIERDANGARQSLQLARGVSLASGEFSARLGYSTRGGEGGQAIGALSWTQSLPSDALSVSLTRQVALNEDEADTVQSALSASWTHKLDEGSDLGLSLSLATVAAAGSAAVEGVTRQSLTASYSRALSPDWGLKTGLSLTGIDRDSTGQARDTAVFVTIGRKFVLLP